MHKVHLETDLCALDMLLRWSKDVQLIGVTIVAEANGRRAGYVKYILSLEGKDGWLYGRIHPSGKSVRVVTKVDGPCFNEFWFRKITNR